MEDNTYNGLTIEQAWGLYQAAKKETYQAIINESQALLMVAKAAGKKDFVVDGQLWQVRVRKNKKVGEAVGYDDPKGIPLAFLCKLKTTPKKWLQQAREKKLQEAMSNEGGGEVGPGAGSSQTSSQEQQPETYAQVSDHPSMSQQLTPQVEKYREEENNRPQKLTTHFHDDLEGGTENEDGIVEMA